MTFTAGQVFAFVIAVIGLILTILNIYDKIINIKKQADAPLNELEERVTALEVKYKEHEDSLKHGNDEFRNIRDTVKAILGGTLALVDFELSYCGHTDYDGDTNDLQEAKTTLRKYLAGK